MNAIRRRILAPSAAVLAVLATACLNDRLVEPNDATTPVVRLGFNATILGAAEGQTVHIRAFYRRTDETEVTLQSAPLSVSVTPGVAKQVAVVVRVAECLADPQQQGGSATQCAVAIALTLEDESGAVIDEQTSPPAPPLAPGSTTTIAQPIIFAPVASVAFGTIPVLRQGETRTFTASALDGQGNAITSKKIQWSTENPNILTVDPVTGAVRAVTAGSVRVTATAGVRSASTTVRVIRRVDNIVVSPDPAPNVRAAATLPLVASPKSADGADAGDLADRTIIWSVVNPAGATQTASVSATGTVTGMYPGDADVTVSVDGVTKTVRLRVTAASVGIQSPSTFVLIDTKMSLKANVLDANNGVLAGVPVTWSTSDPKVATVDATGVVTAVGPGLATITATGGGASGTSAVHVTSLALDIQPANAAMDAGTTLQLTAPNAVGPVTWTASANQSIAEVSPSGIVTAYAPGTVTIVGTTTTAFGVQRGTATVVVRSESGNGPFISVPGSPVTLGSTPVLRQGEIRTLIASALDGQGNSITLPSIRWSTDNPGVLTIDPVTGAATAVAPGSVRVTATAAGRFATATVRVIRRVTSVGVNPDPAPTVRAAEKLSLVANPKSADGTDAGDLADRVISWNVVNPAGGTRTANVSTTGLVTGVYPGDADVTVSVDGVSKTVRVRVTAARIAIQSDNGLLSVATTTGLKATVLDAVDAPLANVPVTWNTSNPAVATVDATGVVTAVGTGLAIITATGGGASGTTLIHVTSLVLDIQPNTPEVGVGNTVQLAATNAMGPVTWKSSDQSVATVSATGLVTAVSPGTVSITGTTTSAAGVQQGTATVVVVPNDSFGLVATPRRAGSLASAAEPASRPSLRN